MLSLSNTKLIWVGYLPTLSIVRLSSSSYSCIVSWQLILLLLYSLAISISFTSVFVLVLRGTFDSDRTDVFNFLELSSVEPTMSDCSRLDERTKGQSSFSGVLSDTGFVEIFIVSKFSRLLLWFAYQRYRKSKLSVCSSQFIFYLAILWFYDVILWDWKEKYSKLKF